MEDYIKNLAAAEGWTDATTVAVLAGVLQQLVDMGAADADDLQALVRNRGGVGGQAEDEAPEDGDVVHMRREDATIIVQSVPEDQPDAHAGIWTIVDQYGEQHRIERDGVDEPWYVVVPAI